MYSILMCTQCEYNECHVDNDDGTEIFSLHRFLIFKNFTNETEEIENFY